MSVSKPNPQTDLPELIRARQVAEWIGLSRTAIYDLARTGRFPQPIRLGRRAVFWRRADIQRWLDDQAAA